MASFLINELLKTCGVSSLVRQQLRVTRKCLFNIADIVTDALVLRELYIDADYDFFFLLLFGVFLANANQFHFFFKKYGCTYACAFGIVDISSIFYVYKVWQLTKFDWDLQTECV